MAKLSKEERKARIRQWRAVERTELVESIPMTPEQLNSLLDYLDANIKSCDHSTKLTNIFLQAEKIDKNLVLPWLAEHGGYCDCEVLFNLEDLAVSFCESPIPKKPKQKKKRAPRDLTTKNGWDLTALPRPWRIANLYDHDEPLQIQMGKKDGCVITIVESTMPPGDRTSDDYWSQLWYARTDLPKNSPIQVSHGTLDLPSRLQSSLVQTSGWIPVYCWIVPNEQEWYLEARTELRRQQGDLSQIALLVRQMDNEQA